MEIQNENLLDISPMNAAELPCELLSTPLPLKDKILRSFITAGITKQAAEDYLTQCELALPMDSTENWIRSFIRERHETIRETRPELLTDTVGYFAALGLDHPPQIDTDAWQYETLFNIAWFHIQEALLVVTCPLENNVPPDTWTLVHVNSQVADG